MSTFYSLTKALNPNLLVKRSVVISRASTHILSSRALSDSGNGPVHVRTEYRTRTLSSLASSTPSLNGRLMSFVNGQKMKSIADVSSSRPMSTAQIETANNIENESSAEDRRAEVKQDLVTKARSQTNKCKSLFQSAVKGKGKGASERKQLPPEKIRKLHNDWITHEILLADAYSKAIKYTAKLKEEGVALKAQRYLDEMIQRHEDEELFPLIAMNKSNFVLEMRGIGGDMVKVNFADEAVDELLQAFNARANNTGDWGETETEIKPKGDDDDGSSPLSQQIPVPTRREFHNVLHSWASSKVKKKGMFAENLLYRMLELAFWYPDVFDMPDSRTFGLAVKCYAGSTYKDALYRIRRLHSVHDQLVNMNCNIPSLAENDPFLLMHSIKGIQSYNRRSETKLIESWFDRLHSEVMKSGDSENPNADYNIANSALDLTATYNAVIRGFGKLRGKQNESQKAEDALHRMREISELSRSIAKSGREPPVTVEVKSGAYNIVIGSYASSKDEKNAVKALAFLNSMIDSLKKKDAQKGRSYSLIPSPDDLTFASTIHALSLMKNKDQAVKEAEKAVGRYESFVMDDMITKSSKVHNACIDFYINLYGRDKEKIPNLLSMCKGMVTRLERISVVNPEMIPNPFTFALILKACAADDGNEVNRTKRMKKAEQVFEMVREEFTNSGTEFEMIDKCYFYMMKCVESNSTLPSEEKKERFIEIFEEACKGGFVSADVLQALRRNVPSDEFTEIVGDGRLADHWTRNVKSVFTLYTDGTAGGKDKHARRKGKSTSGWARKQRERGEILQERKQAKMEKKRLKKEREQRHSKRKS